MPDHLYTLLQRAAAEHGDRPAIDMPAPTGPTILSYRRLLDRSDRLSSLLAEQGGATRRPRGILLSQIG